MSIFLPNTVAECTRKIGNLKKSISDGYSYIEVANIPEHVQKHITKRINKEEEYLETLEKRRREIIAKDNEQYDNAVYAVANNW